MPVKKKKKKPPPTTAAMELTKKQRALRGKDAPVKDFPLTAKAPRAANWKPPGPSDLNANGKEAYHKKPRWEWTPDDQGQLYTWQDPGPLGIKIKPADGNEMGKGAVLR